MVGVREGLLPAVILSSLGFLPWICCSDNATKFFPHRGCCFYGRSTRHFA